MTTGRGQRASSAATIAATSSSVAAGVMSILITSPPSCLIATRAWRRQAQRAAGSSRSEAETSPDHSQWHVAVLAPWKFFALGTQHAQAGDDLLTGLGGVDHVVDVSTFSSVVRVCVLLRVLGDELRTTCRRVGGLLQLAPVDDLDSTLWTHHRKLRGRPGVGKIGTDRLGVHDDVRTAIRLPGDDLDPRNGRLTVRVQQLGSVADDAAVFLVHSRKKTGHVDEGQQRNVEGVAGTHEARGLLGALDVEHTGEHQRLVADDANRMTVDTAESAHDAACPVR